MHDVNGVWGYHVVHGVRKRFPWCKTCHYTCRNPGKEFWILLTLLISLCSIVLYLIFSNICCEIAFRVIFVFWCENMYTCVHVFFSGVVVWHHCTSHSGEGEVRRRHRIRRWRYRCVCPIPLPTTPLPFYSNMSFHWPYFTSHLLFIVSADGWYPMSVLGATWEAYVVSLFPAE